MVVAPRWCTVTSKLSSSSPRMLWASKYRASSGCISRKVDSQERHSAGLTSHRMISCGSRTDKRSSEPPLFRLLSVHSQVKYRYREPRTTAGTGGRGEFHE